MNYVTVPLSLRRDTNWEQTTTPDRLTEVLLRKIGAPHLDSDDEEIQALFVPLADEIVRALDKTDVLPDVERWQKIAGDAAHRVENPHHVALRLGLRDTWLPSRCSIGGIDAALRSAIDREIRRLLLRASMDPPRPRERREAA